MKILIWVVQHIILPFVLAILAIAAGYYSDWGGTRSAGVTTAIQEIETAVKAAYERCGPVLPPDVHDELVQAENHKWAAIEARENKQFDEAYSQLRLARECIQRARERGCPEIYVPTEKPWW